MLGLLRGGPPLAGRLGVSKNTFFFVNSFQKLISLCHLCGQSLLVGRLDV